MKTKKRFRLVLEHVILRIPGYTSAASAYKAHPTEFLELYNEMTKAINNDLSRQQDQLSMFEHSALSSEGD